MRTTVTIVGATPEATTLAATLRAEGWSVTLAGRASSIVGLIRLATASGCDTLLDAAGPFDAPEHLAAAEASRTLGIPLVAYERPSLQLPREAERVSDVPAAAEWAHQRAHRLLVEGDECRFDLSAFTADPHLFVVARNVAPIPPHPRIAGPGLPARETDDEPGEAAFMREHHIDAVVVGDTGTPRAAETVSAAASLRIPLAVIERPTLPPRRARVVRRLGDVPRVL